MNGQSFEHALDTIRNRIAHREDYQSTVTEPFFGGADVIIDDAEQPYHESFLEHQPAVIDATRYEPRRRVVITRHAERLSSLFYQFRDSSFDEIDYGTKYLVYGTLAQAALDYITHNGDPCQQRLKSSGFQRFRSSAFLWFLQGQRPRFSSGPSSGTSLL